MARRKEKRHPGVVLVRPDEKARTGWRVRYRDPDRDKMVRRSLGPNLRTRAQREAYACKLSDQLARRRLELETGGARKTGKPIAETVELYFAAHPDLRPRTLKEYRNATQKLIAWCAQHGVRKADDLDRRKLMAFREWLINEPKRRTGRGTKRGTQVSTGERRAPRTINKQLTSIGTTLRYLVKREAFSKLTWEAVIFFSEHYRAKAKPGQSTAARALTALEIEHLLQACIEHDEETFSMTRAEKDCGEKGSTLRHEPIGPFAAFVLLTGMRPDSEALKVEWKDVDFDRNVIHVGQGTKTGKTRDVSIDESPMLQRLLDAQHEITEGKGRVWPMSYGQIEAARRRLKNEHDAPDDFKWHGLRKTCQSVLASSPSIYGAASIFLAAKRGGHSVAVCEKHYANAIKLVDPDAKTIEGALGVEELLDQIVEDLEAVEVAA